MKPNKSHIILKIFGFLIFSIGILYICQFFTKTLEEGFTKRIEGFQTASGSIPPQCRQIQDSGRKVILCPSEEYKRLIFQNNSRNLPGKYDNLCIGSDEFSTNYYTCYTRPGPKVYNDIYGIYREFDPIVDNDTMPRDLIPSIDNFCTSYNTNTLKINRSIISTAGVLKVINDTVTSTTRYKGEIEALKRQYCTPASELMSNPCSNIITAYNSLNTMTAAQQLTTAQTAVQTSLNSLSNISTQMFSIYNGSKCQNVARYTLAPIR